MSADVAAAARAKRLPLLDCIRAVAVIMVIFYHVGAIDRASLPDPAAAWLSRFGLLGVDIFFPLSGYLITSFLLNRHGRGDIGVFFLRRFFRIVPLYMAALAAYAVASLVTGTNLDTLHNLWQNALFLTGWVIFHGDRAMVPFTITWSLSVEEFAYILLGLAALALRGRLAWFLAALAVGALALRWWLSASGYGTTYFYPPARLDSIAIGGLVAWAGRNRHPVVVPLLVALGATWLGMQTGRAAEHTLVYLLITLGTCLVIHVVATYLPGGGTAGRTAAGRAGGALIEGVATVGFYSYFIYLFHYFNIEALALAEGALGLSLGFWFEGTLALALTCAQAWLSFRFFEGPLMAYGRRLETRVARRRPPPATAELAE